MIDINDFFVQMNELTMIFIVNVNVLVLQFKHQID